jgi:serine/threonine protein kinase
VVHRDITPNNIIVSPDWSRATLIDFGNAKRLIDHTVGTDNGTFGPDTTATPGYAPPAQALGTAAEDVFAFGVVCADLSNLLTACGAAQSPLLLAIADLCSPADRGRTASATVVCDRLDEAFRKLMIFEIHNATSDRLRTNVRLADIVFEYADL